jgi:O-acetyl-ADP-ribose deacetylase (regulator of RNase III)
MRFSIFAGDITDVKADALCTSTNPRLSLMMGTGGAVRERGGFAVLRACEAILEAEGGAQPGNAYTTTAGLLPHKTIIHCVASDHAHHSSAEIIRQCVIHALAAADAVHCESVAMPLFATGHAHFKLDQALEIMLQALRAAQTNVQHVILVVNDLDRAERVQAIIGGGVEIEVSNVEQEMPSLWDEQD